MPLIALGTETRTPKITKAIKALFWRVRPISFIRIPGELVVTIIGGSNKADPIASISIILNNKDIPCCPIESIIGPAVRATKVQPSEPQRRYVLNF
ncbi:hypothetical protein D3C80_1245840 [compost metagenome]